MDNRLYRVIGVSEYHGTSRNGKEYTITTYEIDVDGQKAKIKSFENGAKIGDYLEVNIGLRKSVYGAELAAVIVGVVPAASLEK